MRAYNYNIGKGINVKKLLKSYNEDINSMKADVNKKLLKKTLKEIFFHDINKTITYLPKEFNK